MQDEQIKRLFKFIRKLVNLLAENGIELDAEARQLLKEL